MKREEIWREAGSSAAILGFITLAGAPLLGLVSPIMAVIPLAFFILCCLVASFIPGLGFFLPVTSRGTTDKTVVSLTFDDGPDPATTPLLLDLLEKHNVKATFFVTGERTAKYGRLIDDMTRRGHEIGNHSFSHDILLMLRTRKRLSREIVQTQIQLKRFGIRPLAFRPPVGITNPKLDSVLQRHGLFCVTFSCRSWDAGNRFVRGMGRRVAKKARPDHIIVLHDICPPGKIAPVDWIAEVESILVGLMERGFRIIPLTELLGRPVMARIEKGDD
ncbi:MAG: polysaccharide deacetylase family protein [Syntrophales bacterium]|jgi:peptidoglycan/xylan/chitin deacetylase (PgdA/CDA1 family)|nr:polysaccharide deacetylase family protein [Syntrophales bacterium]